MLNKIVITYVGFIVWSCILIALGIQSDTNVIRQNISLNFNQSVNLKCPLVPSDRAEWTIETVYGSGIHASCRNVPAVKDCSFGYDVDAFGFAGEILFAPQNVSLLNPSAKSVLSMNVRNFTVQHAQINCTQLMHSVQNMQYVWDIFVTGLTPDQSNKSTSNTKAATPTDNSVCLWRDVKSIAEYSKSGIKGEEFNVTYHYIDTDTMSIQWFLCSDRGNFSVGKCQFNYFRKQCEDVYSGANFAYTTSLTIQDGDVTLSFKKLDSSIKHLTIKTVRNGDYFSQYNKQWTVRLLESNDDSYDDTPAIVTASVACAGLFVLLAMFVYKVVLRRRRSRRSNRTRQHPTPAAAMNRPAQTTVTGAAAAAPSALAVRLPLCDDPPTYASLDHTVHHSTVGAASMTDNGFSDSLNSEPPPAYPGTQL